MTDNTQPEILDWSDKIVLIAEDADDNYFLLTAILKKTKLNLIRAKNGQEAIDICKENENIDAVLMDLSMPVMNGLEATTAIKEFRSELPIIAQLHMPWKLIEKKPSKLDAMTIYQNQ